MAQVNVYNVDEAKTQLSKLLDQVEHGERIVIARHGRPIADLVPHRAQPALVLGGLADVIEFDDDMFVAADDEVAELFDRDTLS